LTGIKVHYDVYDSNEALESKLLSLHAGYDVVVPSGSLLGKLIPAGIFRPLDKSLLPNLKYMDGAIMLAASIYDPDNAHAVPYLWGTVGIGYNVRLIQQRLPDAPVDSLDMFFKPQYAKKFADCGIAVLDAPTDILEIALNYLGRSPYSARKEDYK